MQTMSVQHNAGTMAAKKSVVGLRCTPKHTSQTRLRSGQMHRAFAADRCEQQAQAVARRWQQRTAMNEQDFLIKNPLSRGLIAIRIG